MTFSRIILINITMHCVGKNSMLKGVYIACSKFCREAMKINNFPGINIINIDRKANPMKIILFYIFTESRSVVTNKFSYERQSYSLSIKFKFKEVKRVSSYNFLLLKLLLLMFFSCVFFESETHTEEILSFCVFSRRGDRMKKIKLVQLRRVSKTEVF